jgi:hypothetical protein
MWSEKYQFFHEALQASMKDSEFTLMPINIEQSYFDENLYKIENAHAWAGCSLRIDLIIERLENADTSYILFSDVDIVAKSKIYENMKGHIEKKESMVFLQNNKEINIGFVLLKVCPEVIEFWKGIRLAIMEKPGHDQKYVNDLIKGYTGSWTKFDSQLFTRSNIWNHMSDYSIFQPHSSSLGRDFDFAEKIFTMAQHLDVQEFMKYVPENMIPFIYKIQELLYLSHKEMKKN